MVEYLTIIYACDELENNIVINKTVVYEYQIGRFQTSLSLTLLIDCVPNNPFEIGKIPCKEFLLEDSERSAKSFFYRSMLRTFIFHISVSTSSFVMMSFLQT